MKMIRITNEMIADRALRDTRKAREYMKAKGLPFAVDESDVEDACRTLREEAGRDWSDRAAYVNDVRMEKVMDLIAKLEQQEQRR